MGLERGAAVTPNAPGVHDNRRGLDSREYFITTCVHRNVRCVSTVESKTVGATGFVICTGHHYLDSGFLWALTTPASTIERIIVHGHERKVCVQLRECESNNPAVQVVTTADAIKLRETVMSESVT